MKKIELQHVRGKHIHSTDPRKKAIVATFRKLTGCSKVTLLRDTGTGFVGHCLKKAGRTFDSLGWHELETAEVAGV